MQRFTSIEDIVRAFKRRFWLMVMVTLVLSALTLPIAAIWPVKYTASTKLLVQTGQISSELARSTVAENLAERLSLLTRRLTSRDSLFAIAEQLQDEAARIDVPPAALPSYLATNTEFLPIAVDNRRRVISFSYEFQITHTSTDPAFSAAVVNAFANAAAERGLSERATQARTTLEFFDKEVARLNVDLAAAEDALALFRLANEEVLPSNVQFLRAELVDLRTRDFERRTQETELRDERSVQDQIQPPRRERAQERIKVIDLRLAALARQAAEDQIRMGELSEMLTRSHGVAVELNALQRNYDTVNDAHKAALAKRNDAEVGVRLEAGAQSETFQQLDEALPPINPDMPNRLVIAAICVLFSGGVAFVLAVGLELTDPRIHSVKDMETMLGGLRPLVAIPHVPSPQDSWITRRGALTALVVVLALAAIAAVAARSGALPVDAWLAQATGALDGLRSSAAPSPRVATVTAAQLISPQSDIRVAFEGLEEML